MQWNNLAGLRASTGTATGNSTPKGIARCLVLLAGACMLGCQATPEPFLTNAGQQGKGQDSSFLVWSSNKRQERLPQSAIQQTVYAQGDQTAEQEPVAILAPMVVGEASAPHYAMQHPVVVENHAIGPDVIVLDSYGVGVDQPGIADNISARIGATYYSIDNTASAGAVGILESTKQILGSDFFAHAGAGAEYLDGEWPVTASVGISKLATIEGGEVVKPWIFDGTYDLYWDSEFLGTDDTVYLDQVRMLVGYAFGPRIDAGVWAAVGLQSDSGWQAVPGGRMQVRSDFADRIAAYVAADVGTIGSHVILSAGWEENPGNYFMEGNAFVPLTQRVNFWGGAGYSDAGAYDLVAGLEFTLGARGKKCADPCQVACGPRYRGGWANDNYRGAQRVITPSRARRTLSNPSWEFLPDPPAAVGGEVPPPPAAGGADPVIPPPNNNGGVSNEPPPTDDDCILPRATDRPRREGNLSRLLDSLSIGH